MSSNDFAGFYLSQEFFGFRNYIFRITGKLIPIASAAVQRIFFKTLVDLQDFVFQICDYDSIRVLLINDSVFLLYFSAQLLHAFFFCALRFEKFPFDGRYEPCQFSFYDIVMRSSLPWIPQQYLPDLSGYYYYGMSRPLSCKILIASSLKNSA